MKLTHKAVVIMCGYKISEQIRETDGRIWQGLSHGRRMYNVINKEGSELSSWSQDEEVTCKDFCRHYGLVEFD